MTWKTLQVAPSKDLIYDQIGDAFSMTLKQVNFLEDLVDRLLDVSRVLYRKKDSGGTWGEYQDRKCSQ